MATESTPITLKYLNLPFGLGGRGGVVRFFLMANNIPYEDINVEMSDWGATEKARVVESKENPCGSVPILYTKDADGKDVHVIQHIASARYMARLHGITKDVSAYEEYVQDLVADEYQGFRNAWVDAAFGSDELKATYKSETAPKYLTTFEALYVKYMTNDTYLSVSGSDKKNPLWGDAALYGLLRDNIVSGMITADDLEKSYPKLWAMYSAFGAIPAVKAWTDSKKA